MTVFYLSCLLSLLSSLLPPASPYYPCLFPPSLLPVCVYVPSKEELEGKPAMIAQVIYFRDIVNIVQLMPV